MRTFEEKADRDPRNALNPKIEEHRRRIAEDEQLRLERLTPEQRQWEAEAKAAAGADAIARRRADRIAFQAHCRRLEKEARQVALAERLAAQKAAEAERLEMQRAAAAAAAVEAERRAKALKAAHKKATESCSTADTERSLLLSLPPDILDKIVRFLAATHPVSAVRWTAVHSLLFRIFRDAIHLAASLHVLPDASTLGLRALIVIESDLDNLPAEWPTVPITSVCRAHRICPDKDEIDGSEEEEEEEEGDAEDVAIIVCCQWLNSISLISQLEITMDSGMVCYDGDGSHKDVIEGACTEAAQKARMTLESLRQKGMTAIVQRLAFILDLDPEIPPDMHGRWKSSKPGVETWRLCEDVEDWPSPGDDATEQLHS
jgi:hypothetical protein